MIILKCVLVGIVYFMLAVNVALVLGSSVRAQRRSGSYRKVPEL